MKNVENKFLILAGLTFFGITDAQAGEKRDAVVQNAWKQSENQPTCCNQFEKTDFAGIVNSRVQSMPLDIARTRAFDGTKAAFVGLTLPRMESPYYLQVGSGIKSVTRMGGMGSTYFFDPSIVLLDSDLKEVRRVDSFSCKFADSGIANKGEGGYFGAIKVNPALEKYVVVLANPNSKGKKVDFTFEGRYPGEFWGMSVDWEVPFGPDGIVEFRMAPASLVKRLRDKGCSVID